MLVRQICRAGVTFFDTHLDNEASCEDWRLNVIPRKDYRAVTGILHSLENTDVSLMHAVYIKQKKKVNASLVQYLDENYLKTQFKFKKLLL